MLGIPLAKLVVDPDPFLVGEEAPARERIAAFLDSADSTSPVAGEEIWIFCRSKSERRAWILCRKLSSGRSEGPVQIVCAS